MFILVKIKRRENSLSLYPKELTHGQVQLILTKDSQTLYSNSLLKSVMALIKQLITPFIIYYKVTPKVSLFSIINS